MNKDSDWIEIFKPYDFCSLRSFIINFSIYSEISVSSSIQCFLTAFQISGFILRLVVFRSIISSSVLFINLLIYIKKDLNNTDLLLDDVFSLSLCDGVL